MLKKLPAWLIPALFCAAGLVMAHHPMMKDGMGWIQHDPGDTRFCNYLLEHGYRWMTQQPGHTELWSPPDFFPNEGHLAWAENMLGAMPFYAPWRMVGFPIDTAFQLWILTIGALNFVAAYFFFRRAIKVDTFAASVGAALFAFAGMRIYQVMHYQLFPQFFSIWAVHACWRLAVDGRALSEGARTRWLAVLFLSVAFQIAVGIYLGWFLIFGLTVAGALGLLLKGGRERIFFIFKSHPFTIVLLCLVCIAMLLPIGLRYLGTAQEFGGRPFHEALSMIPQVRSWFYFGGYSWWYTWLTKVELFQTIPMSHEQAVGYGVLTTALCVAGVWAARKDPALRFLAVMLVVLVAVTTLWGNYPDGFTVWKYIWSYFPGAKAIRGVARIALLYLIAVSLFVAVALDRLRKKGTKVALLAIPLGLMSVIEQGETTAAYSKHQAREDLQAISQVLGPECEAFYFSPLNGTGPGWKYQLDAMMLSLDRNLPTLNGYSGQNPASWHLGEPGIHAPVHEERLKQALQLWGTERKITRRVCWAKVALQEGPLRAAFVSQQAPATLAAGQRAPVTMRFRNTGQTPWDPGQRFALGVVADSPAWSVSRAALPRVVKPWEEVDVRFEITAPAQPGKHRLQWRMLQEQVAWFGNASTPIDIEVTP